MKRRWERDEGGSVGGGGGGGGRGGGGGGGGREGGGGELKEGSMLTFGHLCTGLSFHWK